MELKVYNPQEWRLFIDSSVRILKCVQLHNVNKCASMPIGHAKSMKEEYNSIKLILEKPVLYLKHQWEMCADLKVVNFFSGPTKRLYKISMFSLYKR